MGSFEQLAMGQSRTMTTPISEQRIAAFAAVSGDENPVHLDETFAKGTVFGERIAHGMLLASFKKRSRGAH